jgi:site-specific DNA-methyltransferase (adenine-specific)
MADPSNKYVPSKEVKNFHPGFTGDNKDQRSFGYWCSLWLSECIRTVKPGAPIAIFSDWRQLPVITDCVQAGGWIWRGVAVWDKTRGIRPSAGRFRQQAEFIVWGSNGPMPIDYGAPCLNGVFTHAPFKGKQHIAGKPESLMSDIVEICPKSGVILDPFLGSGTTGLAAIRSGRHIVGMEIDPRYAELSANRLKKEGG